MLCSVCKPSCMHVWSVTYECGKLWRFFFLFFSPDFCAIVVLSLHEVWLFLLVYYPHRRPVSHTYCDWKDTYMITVGHRFGKSFGRRPLCTVVTDLRLVPLLTAHLHRWNKETVLKMKCACLSPRLQHQTRLDLPEASCHPLRDLFFFSQSKLTRMLLVATLRR